MVATLTGISAEEKLTSETGGDVTARYGTVERNGRVGQEEEEECRKEGGDGRRNVVVDTEQAELIGGGEERTLTNTMAFIHLFKTFTGPSILGTPGIMQNGGLLLGPLGFILIGYINTWCNVTVVKCCRILCARLGKSSMTYEELMEESFLGYRQLPLLGKLAPHVRTATRVFLVVCQFGILSFYIQIIGTTAQEHLTRASDDYNLSLPWTELFVCLLLIPYSWMRNLKILSWFSLTANLLTLVSIVTIVQYACANLQPISQFPLVTPDPWTIPLFVGASVFTVEGIPMILPLENKTKRPQDYGGICGLITMATTCNICLNVMVGFYGYLSVGDHVTGNILVSLPEKGFYDAVSIVYSVAVFLTYTLQLYLPAEVMATSIKARVKATWIQNNANWMSRTFIVVASYLFAALIPKMELMMSLIGAFSTVVLVFIFPPVAELLVLANEPSGVPCHILVKDVAIFVFGGIAFVMGTYTSLRDIILSF
ncbi:proton-coupled amino acid transporter 1 [Aplysia californica]|uniref:Proton-coupled amino acid transporter 1 n=1 Tax=Aplysia californica TaxID=6500 RepID=A0ABM1VSR5_APLCA|nr:proton-coupled amino acid transporter 1 [Aplysia californica]